MKQNTNFAWPVTSVNSEDYYAFMTCLNEYGGIWSKKKLCIFGAGIRGTEFSILLIKAGYKNIIFTDNNPKKWDGTINGFPIISPEKLIEKKGVLSILISTENSFDIEEQLKHMGFLENSDFFTVKSYLYEKYINEFKRTNLNQVLIMGDCEFSKVSLSDSNMEHLGSMIKSRLGEDQVKILAMHGMGLRAHYHIFKAQLQMNMKPQVLMIMINLDTLTGKQHLLPRSQHYPLLYQLSQSISPDEEFHLYLEAAEERSKNLQIEISTPLSGTLSEKALENKSRIYFKLNYMYELQEDNEGVLYLIKLLRLAKKKNITVIPFIPPVNYVLGQDLCGSSFTKAYDKNIKKLQKLVNQEEIRLLDLSYTLKPEFFAEKTTPDETANEKGREIIAAILEQKIREVL